MKIIIALVFVIFSSSYASASMGIFKNKRFNIQTAPLQLFDSVFNVSIETKVHRHIVAGVSTAYFSSYGADLSFFALGVYGNYYFDRYRRNGFFAGGGIGFATVSLGDDLGDFSSSGYGLSAQGGYHFFLNNDFNFKVYGILGLQGGTNFGIGATVGYMLPTF